MKRIVRKIFSKIFTLAILLLLAWGIYFYRGWFEVQIHKMIGIYYIYQGDKEYKKHELQKAIDYYTQGLEQYPQHYSAWYNLGNIYVVYEDYYSAAEAYENAIKYNPSYIKARMNLGIISAEKLGDFDGAINQYQLIVNSKNKLWFIPFVFNNKKSTKMNKGLAYYNMGVAYREKSIYTQDEMFSYQYLNDAIEAYSKAANILTQDYDSHYNLALAYHLNKNYQDAGINYCKAIEIKPMYYEAHYNLAVLLRRLKMYKESYDELEKATILVSNDKYSSNTASYVFDVLNDVSKSLMLNNDYSYLVEKMGNENVKSSAVTYINGKLVATEELDKAMLENFRTCASKDFFENYQY